MPRKTNNSAGRRSVVLIGACALTMSLGTISANTVAFADDVANDNCLQYDNHVVDCPVEADATTDEANFQRVSAPESPANDETMVSPETMREDAIFVDSSIYDHD